MVVKRKTSGARRSGSGISEEMRQKMELVGAGALAIARKHGLDGGPADVGSGRDVKPLPKGTGNSSPGQTMVPLKRVASLAGVDPRVARGRLRKAGKRPSGRWEWAEGDVPGVVAWLKGGDGA